MDFILNSQKQKEKPDIEFRFGATQLTDHLWLAGEDDIPPILPVTDTWIDFRDDKHSNLNLCIDIPTHVTYIRAPLRDGDNERAEQLFPMLLPLAEKELERERTLTVSCHAGVSRSVLFVWFLLSSKWGVEKAWRHIKYHRPHIEIDEGFNAFIAKRITKKRRGIK